MSNAVVGGHVCSEVDLDRGAVALAERLAERLGSEVAEQKYLIELAHVAAQDVEGLAIARRAYGDSWRKRGGVGAFMMLARKWDRLEQLLATPMNFSKFDVLDAIAAEVGGDGHKGEAVLDGVRDLRRYLLLVEAFAATQSKLPMQRDNVTAVPNF